MLKTLSFLYFSTIHFTPSVSLIRESEEQLSMKTVLPNYFLFCCIPILNKKIEETSMVSLLYPAMLVRGQIRSKNSQVPQVNTAIGDSVFSMV